MSVAQPEPVARPPGGSTAELFHALESPLLAYARRLVADADMAQDLVQEAFMRFHTQREQVREPRSWLYRTVHNLALNHRRAAARLVPLPAAGEDDPPVPEVADPQPLPDEQLARLEGVGFVRLGLANLDARSRELLQLKFAEGLTYKEIGARTGLTEGHVGYLLHHSLKALAAELAHAGLVP